MFLKKKIIIRILSIQRIYLSIGITFAVIMAIYFDGDTNFQRHFNNQLCSDRMN